VPRGGSKVSLTQNQLKLAARLQVLERRVRGAGRLKNEKALAQLHAGAASLAKATQHVQQARHTLGEAYEALRRTFALQPPPGVHTEQN